MSQGRFPFGEEVKKVEQKDRSPKDVFVLGVYASAVHARWIGADGKELVKALAVASEPEIFWRGNIAQALEIIGKIKVPAGLGKLVPANFNGPSGQQLDEGYLKPLGLGRSDVWLSDLLPYARLNEHQIKAIERAYLPRQKEYDLPEVTLEPEPSKLANSERVKEIADELELSKARVIVTLGDAPLKEFIKALSDSKYSKLAEIPNYGDPIKITIRGRFYDWIPLTHPHQSGQLGKSSEKWIAEHNQWLKKKTI